VPVPPVLQLAGHVVVEAIAMRASFVVTAAVLQMAMSVVPMERHAVHPLAAFKVLHLGQQ
jgi:hypothetical protein